GINGLLRTAGLAAFLGIVTADRIGTYYGRFGILHRPENGDSGRDLRSPHPPPLPPYFRGSPARPSGSLPAQPRHALPQFYTMYCRCRLALADGSEGIRSHRHFSGEVERRYLPGQKARVRRAAILMTEQAETSR